MAYGPKGNPPKAGAAAPGKLKVTTLNDFTGGVNYRADAFQLHDTESPDLLNVDVSPDGGFQLRGTVGFINTTTITQTPLHSLFSFYKSDGTNQILVGTSTKTYYGTGGDFTDTTTAWTVSDRQRSATFNDLCYIQNGTDAPRKWTGAAISNLTQTFNDNIAAPNDGDMPIARLIVAHRGYMWVANTYETATRYKNRVRFSHPNRVEDWRTNDYIDIDVGREGDEILALVPLKDRLLVFKQKSVHQITGYSPETFAVSAVTMRTGVVGPDAICSNENEVYWFGWPDGVFRYDGRQIDWLFNNIFPKITDGSFLPAYAKNICLGWFQRRLWVSAPYSTGTVPNRTFVWDPALGRSRRGEDGGWVVYDFGVGAMLDWRPIGAQQQNLALHTSTGKVLKLNQTGDNDDFGGGAVQVAAYYATRWIGDNPAQRKRFRRSDFVVDDEIGVNLRVDVKLDYDTSTIKKSFYIDVVPLGSGGVWSTGGADGMTWSDEAGTTGDGVWGAASTGAQAIHRSPSLGAARAAQLIVNGPSTSKRFGVNAITFKFIPKAMR